MWLFEHWTAQSIVLLFIHFIHFVISTGDSVDAQRDLQM
jgi:hypothetical protein